MMLADLRARSREGEPSFFLAEVSSAAMVIGKTLERNNRSANGFMFMVLNHLK